MKMAMTLLVGIMLLGGGSLLAAEQGMEGMNHGGTGGMSHMKMSDYEYCTKHCNAMELHNSLQTLEKKIDADKAALKNSDASGKMATIESRKNEFKKELDKLVQQQMTMRSDLEKLDKELSALEK